MVSEFGGLPVDVCIRLTVALEGSMCSCHSKHGDSETHKRVGVVRDHLTLSGIGGLKGQFGARGKLSAFVPSISQSRAYVANVC